MYRKRSLLPQLYYQIQTWNVLSKVHNDEADNTNRDFLSNLESGEDQVLLK